MKSAVTRQSVHWLLAVLEFDRCPFNIAALSLPAFVACLWALRGAAPQAADGARVAAIMQRVRQERADALGLGYKKSLDEEIAELQAADKVADELAALKAAQAKK